MSTKKNIRGKRALVTGASSGLGVDFARNLAARGANLVLVARRQERLQEVAEGLRANNDVEVEIVVMDLASDEAPASLHEQLATAGRAIDILINNAGFGLYGDYLEIPWERERAMIDIDVVTVAHLTKLFARDMVSRGWGRILQISSIGAYQPTPTYAAYGAAKAFVLGFGEAVNFELRGTGVSCTVVSPGVTATEFLRVAGQQPTLYQRLYMMKSADVARIGIEAMLEQRASIIPGLHNSLTTWSLRFIPRKLATYIAWHTMREA